jgi:predicted phage terminase large subunit-like protein
VEPIAGAPLAITQYTKAQIQSVRLSRSFARYIEAAWPVYSPKPYMPNWHIDAMAEHLEAVHRRQITKLVISTPPRHGKSSVVAVMFPTWVWCSKPETRFLSGSHKLGLSQRDANASRRLLSSKWYQERWGHVFKLTGDQNTKSLYENDKGGRRLIAGVDAHTTGEGGDLLLADDFLDIEAAMSLAIREHAWDYFDNTWRSRLDPPGADGLPGAMIVIAQRTHEDDVTGHLLREGGWSHLCIAEEHEIPAQVEVTSVGWRDPRKAEGELMWPARRTYADVAILKRNPYKWATLYQQRPAPLEGGIIKRHWWRFWTPRCSCAKDEEGQHSASCPANLPVIRLGKHTYIQAELPAEFDEHLQSWDMNFKGDDEEGSDPGRSRVVGGVWARSAAQFYLRDMVADEWGFNEAEAQVVELSYKWKEAKRKLVENKALGPALIARLRRKLGGFVPVTPTTSKVSRVTSAPTDADKKTRALSMEGTILAGDVYLPHPALAPWVWEYIEEHALFPNGPHDDKVDMTSQALADMSQRVGVEAAGDHYEAMKLGPQGPPMTTIEIFRRQFQNDLKQEREGGKMTPKRRRERFLRVGRIR